ncbi:MAG: head-tail connector protein [Lachnospiraceae bacterium]
MSDADKNLLAAMQISAVEHAKGYAGLTDAEIDKHEDITIAVLALISDMWDNRQTTITGTRSVNRLVENILSMHSTNLLPSGGDE